MKVQKVQFSNLHWQTLDDDLSATRWIDGENERRAIPADLWRKRDLNLSTTRDKLRCPARDQRCHHSLRKLSQQPQLNSFMTPRDLMIAL